MQTHKIATVEALSSFLSDVGRVKLLKFSQPNCGPCRALDTTVARLADHAPGVSVGNIDVFDFPEAADEFLVRSVPTLIIVINGEPVTHLRGATSLGALLEHLQAAETVTADH